MLIVMKLYFLKMPLLEINYFLLLLVLIDYQYFELDSNDEKEKKEKDKAVNTVTNVAMAGHL